MNKTVSNTKPFGKQYKGKPQPLASISSVNGSSDPTVIGYTKSNGAEGF